MEFGFKKMTLEDTAKGIATEGGAVIAGLLGAGFAGKQLENMIKPGVLSSSPASDKIVAYIANNVPKVVLYMLLRGKGERSVAGYGKDIGKGTLGSVVMDTLMRSGNDFAPGTTFKIFNYDVMGSTPTAQPQLQENMQRVLQENSSLRQQLNGALQRIASASPNVTVTPMQSFPPDHDRQYGMMQTTPEAEDRRKTFGAMTPPIEDERNRKYGAMSRPKMNFAGETESVATTFGML